MDCPYCGGSSSVSNSRATNQVTATWRRRACDGCGGLWTTLESIDMATSHNVDTRGTLIPFQRDLLFYSLVECMRHRTTVLSDASALTTTIMTQLIHDHSAVIPRSQIVRTAMKALKPFDEAGYAIYSAMHAVDET